MPGAGVYVATLIGAVKEAVDGKFGVESVSADEDFWVAAPALVPRHHWSHAGLGDADWDLMDELHTQQGDNSDARLEARYRDIWDDESGGGALLEQRATYGRRHRRQLSGSGDGHESTSSTYESTKDQNTAHRKSHHENSKMKGHGTKHSVINWLFGRAPSPPPPPKQPPNPDPKGMNKTMHQTKAPWHLPFASSNVTIKSGGVYHYNATEGRGGEYYTMCRWAKLTDSGYIHH